MTAGIACGAAIGRFIAQSILSSNGETRMGNGCWARDTIRLAGSFIVALELHMADTGGRFIGRTALGMMPIF